MVGFHELGGLGTGAWGFGFRVPLRAKGFGGCSIVARKVL